MKTLLSLLFVMIFVTSYSQTENFSTLEGRIVRKGIVRLDSAALDSLSHEQVAELLKEVDRNYPANNVLVQLLDSLGNEVTRAVTDDAGKYFLSAELRPKAVYKLWIYGNGPNAPPTRERAVFITRRGRNYLIGYYITDYNK